MSGDKKLSHAQLKALVQHMQEVLIAVTDANNELLRRLDTSPTFVDQDRETLNKWSLVINDIHAASDAQVMEIRSRPGPAGLQ